MRGACRLVIGAGTRKWVAARSVPSQKQASNKRVIGTTVGGLENWYRRQIIDTVSPVVGLDPLVKVTQTLNFDLFSQDLFGFSWITVFCCSTRG